MECMSNHCAQQETHEVQLCHHRSSSLSCYKVLNCLQPHTSLHLCLSICAYYSLTGLTSTLINLFPADVMIRLQMINNCFI